MIVHFQAATTSIFAAGASIRRLLRIIFLFKNLWPSAAVCGGPSIRESAQSHSEMVYIHHRYRTYTVGIVGVRYGVQTGNGPPCPLSPRQSPYTGIRCPYTVLHCYTIYKNSLRYPYAQHKMFTRVTCVSISTSDTGHLPPIS